MGALPARYQAQRLIKRGGTAEVYEASVDAPGGILRRVALKRLLPGWSSDPAVSGAFFDEAKIASQLNHPNLVALLDYGVADDRPFQILEYVDGLSLREVLERQGPLPTAQALYVVRELAHGLSYLHQARDREGRPLGLVHRDVTANNVLVSFEGDVKLGDFGIAYALRRGQVTQVGFTKGTAPYMAPEQQMGSSVEPRTDLWAAGCLLHELLTGASPLEDPMVRARAHAGESVPLDPGLTPGLAAVIGRCLKSRPEQRFPSAEAFSEALWAELRQHLDRDPRVGLRELLSPQRAAPARVTHPVADLFDLQLLDGLAPGPIRRFSSVMGGPGHIGTRATPLPHALRARAAGAPGAAARPEEEGPGAEPTALAEATKSSPPPNPKGPSTDPTALYEPPPIHAPTRLTAEPAAAESTRTVAPTAPAPAKFVVGLAFVAMLGLGVALGMFLRRPVPSSPREVVEIPVPVRSSTPATVSAPTVAPRAEPPLVEAATAEAPTSPEATPPANPPNPEPRRAHRAPRQEEPGNGGALYLRALADQGLTTGDLELDREASAAWAEWRKAEGAARAVAERRLVATIEAYAIDPAELADALARVERALREVLAHPGVADPASLDRRLIDLKIAGDGAKSPTERLNVARAAQRFRADLRQL